MGILIKREMTKEATLKAAENYPNVGIAMGQVTSVVIRDARIQKVKENNTINSKPL